MRIVVTGGRGFIGTPLVRALAERENAQVAVIVRSARRNPWKELSNVELLKSSGSGATKEMLAGANAVVNLAYDFSAPQSELLADFDRLVLNCETARVGAFIQFSSIAVYDEWPGGHLTESSPADGPGNIYKMTKRSMERRLAHSGLHHTILQPTIVYGTGSTQWTEKVFDRLRTGDVVLPAGEEGLCHAVHVNDVVDAAIAAIRGTGASGDRYIISGPEPVGWRAFYKAHADLIGKPAPRLEDLPTTLQTPPAAARPAAGPVRKLLRSLRSVVSPQAVAAAKRGLSYLQNGGRRITYRPTPSELVLLRARGSCSISQAQERLGYRPKIDFDTGMRLIAESLQRQVR